MIGPLAMERSSSHCYLCLKMARSVVLRAIWLKSTCLYNRYFIEKETHYSSEPWKIIHHRGQLARLVISEFLTPLQMRGICFQVLDVESEYVVTHFLRNVTMKEEDFITQLAAR